MSPRAVIARRITADVGGTHTRLAIHDGARDEFRYQQVFLNRDFGSFEAVLTHWLQKLDEPRPEAACLAVAALVRGDRITMTNLDWSFSCGRLAETFDFRALAVLNDFEAHAHALPWLREQDLISLQTGHRLPGKTTRQAVLGPGTGFGGALLEQNGNATLAVPCEPGHMNLAPGTIELAALWPDLLANHGRIHVERLLSGAGLTLLHDTLRRQAGAGHVQALSPAEITARALDGTDPDCRHAVACFCSLLGDLCADVVLATGAWGGLYLAGGILPRITPLLLKSRFLERLHDRGPLTEALRALPVNLIRHPCPGLVGAAHAPLQQGTL